MRLVVAIVTILSASPVWSQTAAECWSRDILAAYLREAHDMRLYSWGLNSDGNMEELFLSESGQWAVVETTPLQCSRVRMPDRDRGRLWVPPPQNELIPPGRIMSPGDPA